MRRRNREINIFSMSALDLFASALGAFMLIALISLPYYLKTHQVLMVELRQANARIDRLEEERRQLQEEKKLTREELAQTREDAARMEKELRDQVDIIQESLDESHRLALLGIVTQAREIVIIIDMSGSMDGFSATLQRVIREIIPPMNSSFSVQIIGYQGDDNAPTYWNWLPPYQLESMSEPNKALAIAYVDQMTSNFKNGTPTGPALLTGLAYPADAIILISDGAPNGDWQTIINDITRRNNGAQEIHTVALGNYNSNRIFIDFMMGLAQNNNGYFAGVAN
jgi:outer membrane murein-binding lipoprotein Lpp